MSALNDVNIALQLFCFITGDKARHCVIISCMAALVKCIIIGGAVSKLYIHWQQSGLDQLEIEQKPPRAPVPVNKGMNAFKTYMQSGNGLEDVMLFPYGGVVPEKSFHLYRHKEGFGGAGVRPP